MPLNVDVAFIGIALKALKQVSLTGDQQKRLCDELIKLCDEFAPGTFKTKQ